MLKQSFSASVLVCLLAAAFTSCLKEHDLKTTYYGNVSVNLVNLPNTPTVDVYLNDEKRDTLSLTHTATGFDIPTGDQQRLSIYKANTNTLIADTLFDLPKNTNLNYRFAYSEDLGLMGFLGETQVAADSAKVQILYKANQTLYPYPVVDLVIYNYVSNPSPATTTEWMTIKGLAYNKLSGAYMFPRIRIPGTTTHYFFLCKLRDPATGEIIKQKYNNGTEVYLSFLNTSTAYDGKYMIFTYSDDGGSETTNKFKSTLSTL